MRRYSIGKSIMVVLWLLLVFINGSLPWDINEYLEVVILIAALMSIEVLGEAIDRKFGK